MPVKRALLALAVAWGLYAGWVAAGAGLVHVTANDLLYLCFPWAAVASAVAASRRVTLSSAVREGWGWIAVGLAVSAVGSLGWLALDLSAGGTPVLELPDWTAVTYLLYYPLVVRGLTSFPTARRLRAEARRGWLDGVLVTTGIVTAGWYLLWNTTHLFAAAEARDTLTSLVILGSDFFVAWAALSLARERDDLDARRCLVVLVIGLLVLAGSDTLLSLDQLNGTYRSGRPVDALTSLGYALLAAAPILQQRSMPSSVPEEQPITARAAVWPMVALVATVLPLGWEGCGAEGRSNWCCSPGRSRSWSPNWHGRPIFVDRVGASQPPGRSRTRASDRSCSSRTT